MGLEIGKTYYVRTDTDHWVGRLVGIDGPFTVSLEQASWVAESGRLHQFCKRGEADGMEIEPVGKITCHWRAIIDWPHKLFTEAV